MFGLTKREQRWKAEQQAAEVLAGLVGTLAQAAAQVSVAEAQTDAAELARLRVQVRKADERGDLATRRAHAALAALERIQKMTGEECFEYRRIALEALAADERLLDGA